MIFVQCAITVSYMDGISISPSKLILIITKLTSRLATSNWLIINLLPWVKIINLNMCISTKNYSCCIKTKIDVKNFGISCSQERSVAVFTKCWECCKINTVLISTKSNMCLILWKCNFVKIFQSSIFESIT